MQLPTAEYMTRMLVAAAEVRLEIGGLMAVTIWGSLTRCNVDPSPHQSYGAVRRGSVDCGLSCAG